MPRDPSFQPVLADGDLRLVPVPPHDGDELRFGIEVGGQQSGHVTLLAGPGPSLRRLCWQVAPELSDGEIGARSLRLLIAHAFDNLGVYRVEALVPAHDRDDLRAAARAGMRKEGVVRGAVSDEEARHDAVLLGRLADDPAPDTRAAFTAWLNSSLPTKRAIAQALIRDDQGRVLVCELVYKKPWDLPGGVVDPFESPADAVLRELHEELDVTAQIRSLAAVSWLPAWRGWDDAVLFVFDVHVPAGQLDRARLQPHEIRAVHWVDDEQLAQHVADYTTRVVRRAQAALDAGAGTVYLEDGEPVGWADPA